jgi:hypothetical protein
VQLRFAITIAVLGAISLAPVRAHAHAPPQLVRVDDLDYVHRTYYFLADHPIRVRWGTLHVWRDDRIQFTNTMESPGIARVDPLAVSSAANPEILGHFGQLTLDQDYFIMYLWISGLGEVPILRLRTPLKSTELLAVSYVDELPATPVQVGTLSGADFSEPDPILEKPANCLLVKLIGEEINRVPIDPVTSLRDRADPFYSVTEYELRNLYDLRLRNIPRDRFQLVIRRKEASSPVDPDEINGKPLIGILGLDQEESEFRTPVPDGLIDDAYIEYEQGLLFLPDLHPFNPDTSQSHCSVPWGGFLCLDNIQRNGLWQNTSMTNPHVYDDPWPDPATHVRYYLESTIYPPPEPLSQNAPNPFNPGTRIDFKLDRPGRARVSIYDVHGRMISELVDKEMTAGHHSAFWDGKSGNKSAASGVYYYVLETSGHTYRRRMVLAR